MVLQLLPFFPPMRLKLLVADDNESVRDLMAAALEEDGYEIDTAVDGDAAWKAVRAKAYDLIITDDRMPGISGMELIKRVRQSDTKLPCLLITGNLVETHATANSLIQPGTILSKPFTATTLLSAVRQYLPATIGS